MYDRAPQRYLFPAVDFGAGGNTLMYIKGPKGKRGFLYDYGVFGLTEAFAGSTSTPNISVGTIADPDAYGDEFDMGALAINAGLKSIRESYSPGSAAFDAKMLNRDLPADTVIMVTCVAAVGTPTGTGAAFVDVIWEN